MEINNITLVSISGKIDLSTAEQLDKNLQNQIRNGNARIIIDFTDIEFIDSAGLRILLGTTKQARLKGGDVRLANVIPDIINLLSLTGFLNLLKVFPSVDTAFLDFR